MKYLIGALVVLALLFLIWWFISRGKQRQLDEQRAEAASIRAAAEQRGATLRGQETFAQHAGERASLARHEAEERARQAEESAREAQRVEDEARRHQEDLERARLTHEAELRRADEIDPDVEVADGDPRPLPEDLDDDVRPPDETRVHAAVPTFQPSAPAGAVASGAGAAAVGSAYAATRGDVTDDEAARLASGADYADNEPHAEESAAESTDTSDSTEQSDGNTTIINDVEDYASTEPLPAESDAPTGEPTTDESAADEVVDTEDDVDSDVVAAEEPTTEETWNDEDTSVDAEPTSDPDAGTDGGDATHWPDGTDRINTLDDDSADGSSRRIAGVDEIRDGGFGVGSAAPFEDGAQPADHPVQAYNDTRTFRVPGAPGYDSAEPDVWFYDEEAARRAGFNPSQG